ncbi:hypothetical protein VOLCADRAFT_108558 [Volvox carteri f. nagariensis]|uniref:Uncharacterized protein n=1 Tax=Volvox carteri f. nagariensis TaxID=3068 RepID=D8UKY0_VOLCA|nr:uncharacterized protein VOLCADRAFT_108558 [Volvox carteri f. nagariensis]EFJ39621.1 hypothetical protein VOLCADRAFT_108558 [Volvox carteri f. nagariensis]|eukprot:XP_002959317.1 hypothetical protein VOLCADRAFT_108558 [Volvox carteri f. nagariensis]
MTQPSDSMQLHLGASLPERKPAGAGLADKPNTTYLPKAAPPGCFTACFTAQKPAGNPALVLAFQLNASKPTGPRPLSLGALPCTPWGWPFGAAQCNPDASLPESITRVKPTGRGHSLLGRLPESSCYPMSARRSGRFGLVAAGCACFQTTWDKPNTEMGAVTAEVETAMAAEGAKAGEQDGRPGAMQLLQPGMAPASGSGLQQPNTEMGAAAAEVDTAMAAEGAKAGEQDGRPGAMQLLQPGMALASGSGLQQPNTEMGAAAAEVDTAMAAEGAKAGEQDGRPGAMQLLQLGMAPASGSGLQQMPTHAAEAAVVEDTAAVVVNHDPEMHLKIFSDQHKTWAEMHNLDLKADEGQLLAAILQWPEQYKPYCGSEGSFHHSFAVCGILVANGMYAPDFNNPKLQAINHFTEDMKSALLSGGLKQFELALLLAGLNPNTEMGAAAAEVDTAMAAEGAKAGEQDGRPGAMQLLQLGMAPASGSGLQQFPKISGPESVQGSSRTEFLQHSNLSLDEERAIRIAKQKEILAKLGLQAIVDNIRSPRSPIRRQSTHSAPLETRRSTRLTVLSSKLSKQQVKGDVGAQGQQVRKRAKSAASNDCSKRTKRTAQEMAGLLEKEFHWDIMSASNFRDIPMPTHAAEAAVVEDTAAVVVNHDPEMHLKIFSDQHKTWAEMHNLDLKADEGQLLAAILQWPEQYKLYCGSEGSFHHSFAVCGILVANGMYAPDFNNPKLQAINHFTEDMKSALLSGGLKQFELALLLAGLNALCQGDVGAQGQQVRKRAKSAASNDCSKRTKRTAQEMAGLLEKEFHWDIMSASNFRDIPEVKVRIAELINKFGGTEGAATMVMSQPLPSRVPSLEEMDKYKSAGGHVSYLNNLADKTIGCYLASVSIEDTIEILVIGKMKGLHHRAKFTLPEPTKTLAIKDYPLTMFDKVTWPVLGILAIDKGRHAVPWACDTLGVSAKQISSALKGNNIKG